jgi:hypothetical protein
MSFELNNLRSSFVYYNSSEKKLTIESKTWIVHSEIDLGEINIAGSTELILDHADKVTDFIVDFKGNKITGRIHRTLS